MILTIWIFLAFTCYAKQFHASPDSTDDEPPKSASSSNETIVINSSTSNPYPQEPTTISTIPEECPITGCVKCSPISLCAAFYDEIQAEKAFCKIDQNTIGVICPKNDAKRSLKARAVSTDSKNQKISSRDAPDSLISSKAKRAPASQPVAENDEKNRVAISSEVANKGVQQGNVSLQQRVTFEKDLQSQGFTITKVDSPEFAHLQFFQTTPQTEAIAKIGFLQELASISVTNSLKLTAVQARVSISGALINPIAGCPPLPTCNLIDNYYRRIDGGCNNLQFTDWGKSFTPFARKIPNRYIDGISIPRSIGISGSPLPSARKISSSVALDVDKPSSKFTLSVMQWGQYIDHDLTHSSISRYGGTTGIQCCGSAGPLPPSQSHPECFPIEIPSPDPFFPTSRRCMNFVRSLPAPSGLCNTLTFRNQMNQITHYLDGSAVYGSTDDAARNLRQSTGGLLKVRPGDFLPDDFSTTSYDFLAGDSRVNEQPHLSVIHTIWMREHNRVAKKLAQLHSSWSHDTIYQETRKIIVAEIQHIVYNEWLPLIIGPLAMSDYDLIPLTSGFVTDYTKDKNPSIMNEFSTVAFRFGHTLVQGNLRLFDSSNTITETLELANNFDKPSVLVSTALKFDEFVRGLYLQPMQNFDNCVVDDLTNKLFKTPSQQDGLDLVALNIQRGRDHGIGSYNDLRSSCGRPTASSVTQLAKYMPQSAANALFAVYGNVEDIDPFIAGISENPSSQGGIVGETFNCIIREQFKNLKFYDRFYYENGDMLSSFSPGQLDEIRKISWARILCDNDQNIIDIQPLAFRISDAINTKVPCTNFAAIPSVDLNLW